MSAAKSNLENYNRVSDQRVSHCAGECRDVTRANLPRLLIFKGSVRGRELSVDSFRL